MYVYFFNGYFMRVINFVVSLFNLCFIKIHVQNYQIFCIAIKINVIV